MNDFKWVELVIGSVVGSVVMLIAQSLWFNIKYQSKTKVENERISNKLVDLEKKIDDMGTPIGNNNNKLVDLEGRINEIGNKVSQHDALLNLLTENIQLSIKKQRN